MQQKRSRKIELNFYLQCFQKKISKVKSELYLIPKQFLMNIWCRVRNSIPMRAEIIGEREACTSTISHNIIQKEKKRKKSGFSLSNSLDT